jgi:hypothetical protein
MKAELELDISAADRQVLKSAWNTVFNSVTSYASVNIY